MTGTGSGGSGLNCAQGGPQQRAWALGAAERRALVLVAGLVTVACALGPFVSPYTRSGASAFAVSVGISLLGAAIIIAVIKLVLNRNRKLTVLLLPAVLVIAAAGAVGGGIGYLISRPGRAVVTSPAPTRRQSPSPSAGSSRPVAGRTFTEIADNRNGVPVFAGPDGSSANASRIPFATKVQVSCHAPNESGMTSVNAFYLIKTPPWRNLYAPADTFANGDPVGEAGSANIDPAVPACPRT